MKKPSELVVSVPGDASTTARVYPAGSPAAGAALVLGHGAGAGQQSAFMVDFATALARLGVDTVTFNFLYTERRRRIPDRGAALEMCYRSVVQTVHAEVAAARQALFIGGKSMGGRIATQIAAADRDLPIAGLVLLGYPLHPPGRPAERRDKHLAAVGRPMLFVQGSRDAFGTPEQLTPILAGLHAGSVLRVVEDGDHSFKLPRKDPAAQSAVYANVQQDVIAWMRTIIRSASP